MCIRDRRTTLKYAAEFKDEQADERGLTLPLMPVSYTHLDVYKRQGGDRI